MMLRRAAAHAIAIALPGAILLGAALLGAAQLGAAPAREKSGASGAANGAAAEGPLVVFKNFEKAWRGGDAQALSAIASDAPILVEIRGIEQPGGYYTKAQLFYILKDLFGGTNQLSFQFVKYHNLEKRDLRIYGIAQRSYRVKSSGGLFRDKVYVTLVREGSRWAVAEIKSTW